jgi:hypothetical protein
VPLTPNAIEIAVIGTPDQASQLQALLAQLLATVNGDSNWPKPDAFTMFSTLSSYRYGIMVSAALGAILALFLLHSMLGRYPILMCMVGLLILGAVAKYFPPDFTQVTLAVAGGLIAVGVAALLIGLWNMYPWAAPE